MNFLKNSKISSIFLRSTPAADHKNNGENDVDSGICTKTTVVFWIINVVTKSGNAPFRHFVLNADTEAKFPLVYKSDKSRFQTTCS